MHTFGCIQKGVPHCLNMLGLKKKQKKKDHLIDCSVILLS